MTLNIARLQPRFKEHLSKLLIYFNNVSSFKGLLLGVPDKTKPDYMKEVVIKFSDILICLYSYSKNQSFSLCSCLIPLFPRSSIDDENPNWAKRATFRDIKK